MGRETGWTTSSDPRHALKGLLLQPMGRPDLFAPLQRDCPLRHYPSYNASDRCCRIHAWRRGVPVPTRDADAGKHVPHEAVSLLLLSCTENVFTFAQAYQASRRKGQNRSAQLSDLLRWRRAFLGRMCQSLRELARRW